MMRLFESSTCFEQLCPRYQENNCINTTSGLITPCEWPSGMQFNNYIRSCINTTVLLKMST